MHTPRNRRTIHIYYASRSKGEAETIKKKMKIDADVASTTSTPHVTRTTLTIYWHQRMRLRRTQARTDRTYPNLPHHVSASPNMFRPLI